MAPLNIEVCVIIALRTHDKISVAKLAAVFGRSEKGIRDICNFTGRGYINEKRERNVLGKETFYKKYVTNEIRSKFDE